MLLIIALVLPIYWLREGGRRAGAEVGFGERAAAAGERLAEELECVVCHGADLGGANYAPVVLDIGNQFSDEDTFIVKTTWRAPALDNVFTRFDTDAENLDEVDEVRQILICGRVSCLHGDLVGHLHRRSRQHHRMALARKNF